MHFDDRLETVLRLPDSGDGLARIQFRQLIDLLGRVPSDSDSLAIDAAFARIETLSRRIPAVDRARLLRQPLQPVSNARLVSFLAGAEPDVASAIIASAKLDDAQWLTLIPRLPVRARGILRHRRDMSPRVEALLESLGIHDRGLPPADPLSVAEVEHSSPVTGGTLPDSTEDEPYISDDVLELLDIAGDPPPPTSLSEWAQARAARLQSAPSTTFPADDAGIGAIVRRIEEFRKARGTQAPTVPDADAPRLPLGDAVPNAERRAETIDFTTDAEGRIDWTDGIHAPAMVGFSLPTLAARGQSPLPLLMRRHFPFQAVRLHVDGAPAVEGEWQADGVPRFDPASGRFEGYCGRLRRPAQDAPVNVLTRQQREAERMREILHELRTPANAIQVAAEIIQQQLYGPAPHEYRALAAAIASDCAHILAGFEELDRLVKLETGALEVETGDCDLSEIIAQTVSRLQSWTSPRRSGFVLAPDAAGHPLHIAVEGGEAERLVWRLFAALAGATAPDEALNLSWRGDTDHVVVTLALPQSLAMRSDEELFGNQAPDPGQSLSAGIFGVGFTLRLAAAEAAASGGSLKRESSTLRLCLPGLTLEKPHHSNIATVSG